MKYIYKTKVWFCIALLTLFAYLTCNSVAFAEPNEEGVSEHLNMAEQYHDQGEYEKAKVELETALTLDPKNAGILNSLGAIYLNLSETSQDSNKQIANLASAKKYFSTALKIDPNYSAAWNGIAGAYYLSGQNGDAVSCYKKALVLGPKRAYEVYTNLANTQRDAGEVEDAEQNYKKAIELNSAYAQAHNGYAELLYNKQRVTEALHEAMQAIKQKPDYATAYYHLGLIQSARANKTDALKAYLLSLRYEKNVRYAKETRSLINQLGLDAKLVSKIDLDKYQSDLCGPLSPTQSPVGAAVTPPIRNIPEHSDNYRQTHIEVVHSLMDKKDWKGAVHELSTLLKKYPDDPEILNALGLVYIRQKKYTAAEKLFKKIICLNKGELGGVYYNLGQSYLCNREFDRAQYYLEKAKQSIANDSAAKALINNSLGVVYKQKGNFSSALQAYQSAIAIDRHYPVFHYNLAILLEQMHRNDQAGKEYALYLQLEPNGMNAKNARAKLSSLVGNTKP